MHCLNRPVVLDDRVDGPIEHQKPLTGEPDRERVAFPAGAFGTPRFARISSTRTPVRFSPLRVDLLSARAEDRPPLCPIDDAQTLDRPRLTLCCSPDAG